MVLPLIAGGGVLLGAAIERYGIPILNPSMVKGAMTPKNANVETVAYNAMRSKLEASEGYKLKAYIDTVGVLTVGIGHRVMPLDNIKVNQTITAARVEAFYKKDVDQAFKAAVAQSKEINKYNADMIIALCEVNFQLGKYWRSKFPNTWSLIKSGQIEKAKARLFKSAWNSQTPNRVANFVAALNRNFA